MSRKLVALSKQTRLKWRALLTNDAGIIGLAYLRENKKRIRTGTDVQPHHIQMDAGFQEGYEEALRDLWKLAEDPEPPSAEQSTPQLEETQSLGTNQHEEQREEE